MEAESHEWVAALALAPAPKLVRAQPLLRLVRIALPQPSEAQIGARSRAFVAQDRQALPRGTVSRSLRPRSANAPRLRSSPERGRTSTTPAHAQCAHLAAAAHKVRRR